MRPEPEITVRRLTLETLDAFLGMARMEASPYSQPWDDAHRYRGTIELYESAGYEKVAELPGGTTLMEKRLD